MGCHYVRRVPYKQEIRKGKGALVGAVDDANEVIFNISKANEKLYRKPLKCSTIGDI